MREEKTRVSKTQDGWSIFLFLWSFLHHIFFNAFSFIWPSNLCKFPQRESLQNQASSQVLWQELSVPQPGNVWQNFWHSNQCLMALFKVIDVYWSAECVAHWYTRTNNLGSSKCADRNSPFFHLPSTAPWAGHWQRGGIPLLLKYSCEYFPLRA